LACFKEDSKFYRAATELPEEYMLKDEVELGKLFRVTPLDYAMKKQLWTRFCECENVGIYKLKTTDIFGGLCTNSYFYKELIENPARVAWLITPTVDTQALIEEAYRFSFQRVRDDILTMPVTEKSAPILLKAFQYFADRHLGPMIQRIESKNLNVEVQGGKMETPTDPHEIEAKLREIRAKLLPTKDVTPTNE
jgi:hypothetical protein